MTEELSLGSLWPLEGAFRCGDGFLAAPECLGQTFHSRTASHAVSMTLPRFEAGALIRPPWRYVREGEDRVPAEADDHWGSVAGSKAADGLKYAHVLHCVVHSEVMAIDNESFKAVATRFGDELADWWTLVCDWLDVLTLQDFAGLGRAQRSILDDSIQLWSGDSNGIRCAGVNYQVMGAGVNWAEVLDKQQLQVALDLAASDSSPHIEWLLLRDARSLLNAREYRRAVIDACTAAELSVTALIDRLFDLSGTRQEERARQFAKYHGLAKLIELHNRFKAGKLPKRLYQEVGAPRNKAAHVGAMLNEADARTAISKAAEVVAMAFPLGLIAPTAIENQIRSVPHLGILPREGRLVLTLGNDLHVNFHAVRRERPPPRQPPALTGVLAVKRRRWRFWSR